MEKKKTVQGKRISIKLPHNASFELKYCEITLSSLREKERHQNQEGSFNDVKSYGLILKDSLISIQRCLTVSHMVEFDPQ